MRNLLVSLLLTVALAAGTSPARGVASTTPSPSPDPTHPQITQEAAQQVATAPVSAPTAVGGGPTGSSAITGAFGPSREVFGFALASSLADTTYGYPTWDFSLLTTVAFFGLHVNDDGTFASDSGMTVWNSSQLTGLVNVAHGSSTKVVLTIILQDFSSGTPHMCAGLAHYSTTVADAVSEIKAKGVDGLNVDYEGLNGSCGTSDPSWARHQMTTFVAALRTALGPNPFLTVDTYASSAADPLGFYDIGALNVSGIDAFFVMAYDLEYSNYSHPPTSCPSFCLGPTGPLAGYYYNEENTITQYTSLVLPSHVILGVPYYGRKACVSSPGPNAVPTGTVSADMYLDASTEATSSQVQPGSYAVHRDANDPAGQERWDTWYNTSLACTRELYWDDTTSLGHKYDLVNSTNIRGVGIWTLNYGGGAPELWQLLHDKFAPALSWTSIGGVTSSGPAASSWGNTRVDAFARGTDNALWQRTWNGTAWGAWTSLGGAITAEPGAVSWGSNRIDAFVRGSDGALWHRAWDGTKWWPWEGLGGQLAAGADVASWGANRLDVFVTGTDHALWHRAWDGTKWWPWERLGGYINGRPAAVSWSQGRIDIFARGGDNQMWHMAWAANAWSGWQALGGQFLSAPAASSCVSGHLDVFGVGTDYAMWHEAWDGTKWTGWQRQGGYWSNDAPAAVCVPGTTTLGLFDRGQDSAVWQATGTGT